MTFKELQQYFQSELAPIYPKDETQSLFQIMVMEFLGLDRIALRSSIDLPLKKDDENRLKDLAAVLLTGKPYQQILGKAAFYRLEFLVNEHVLIPRPETEELVELALSTLTSASNSSLSLVDIGTGSGAIPIVLKKHLPLAEIHALDVSEKALEVAKANALALQCPIHFHLMDVLQEPLPQNFDVIVSNPPYIGLDEQRAINQSVKDFEPRLALFSPTNDPLLFYKRIAALVETQLNPGGYLFLEINQKLGPQTLELYTGRLSKLDLIKDLSGNDRFIVGKK